MRRALRWAGALLVLALLFAAAVWFLNVRGEDAPEPFAPNAPAPDTALVARGAYLARVGDCMGCHTERGAAPFGGGRGIETPFGMVYASNLTPHASGIGNWSSGDFWRALHNGRAKDGRLLYPVFPYTSYTQVTRADSDALYAYLRTLAPADRPNRPHTLRFPYNTQAALAVWRALYFRPAAFEPVPAQSAAWNRGAYLVQGLGHCAACHSTRDALGGIESPLALAGGLIPLQNWYAPSLADPSEAGVADWPQAEVVQLFKTGAAPRGRVMGPMAEVVQYGTQYMSQDDLAAMAVYLKALPQHAAADAPAGPPPPVPASVAQRGAAIYDNRCAQCHGAKGEGVPGAYPPLAGNRVVTMANPANLVQAVLYGGFGPATEGNPRPFGMPPYVLALSDEEIAAVLSHLRSQWGNAAAPVTALQVNRARGGTQ